MDRRGRQWCRRRVRVEFGEIRVVADAHGPVVDLGRPDVGLRVVVVLGDLGRTGGSSGEKRPFCDILSQLKPILMNSSALEPPCGARSYELDQKIPAVRRPSKKPLE